MQVAAVLIPMDSKKMGKQLMGWEKDNASKQQRGRLEVFKEAERRSSDSSPFSSFLPNPPSPVVARSISMVHQPEPIGRRWRDRDCGRVGLGIAVALDDDAGPSPRKLHATAPIAICSPRASGVSSNSTGRAGFSVGFCSGSRSQGGDLLAGGVVDEACAADFLSNCYLCRKKLHGKDIFMYREKAFCSMECRYEKMASDEYQEQQGAKAGKRSPEIASSPCSGGQLFFTGIVVT